MSLLRTSARLKCIGRLQRPSIVELHCGRCHHKIDATEGLQLVLRRHMPEASVAAKTSLSHFNWGLKKQVGIYDVGRTSPPGRQVREVLNGSRTECPRCGAVEWRSAA
mmetsp:Transcript_160052/g.489574  ORF Transcript_160052/g.489574 Transcript_160052/m.489574 type:complete len:108 (-) Transcript_160052:4-327(-)|eukprot:CAMPEP_0204575246 /NCGR_PEP_ID=MMETSP0661-20131031/41081_1 /ASSEMBLY_ACC=CAM_ASM_000606 /TAXON_ID=109239 /ORGANISM="Alexandrium margalefi, Strain AMGDE01CS-322" /LENGTH=107 /DNA_ID=CAMNT_0051583859 /DNA_START=99 /DNA_END=422 /DNA_ORIENTATION=-